LISALRASIEQRNFPLCINIIKQLEKFENEYQKLEKMSELESELAEAYKVTDESLKENRALKVQNESIVREVQNLRESEKTFRKKEAEFEVEQKSLEQSNGDLNQKCARMAETLASREIANAEFKAQTESNRIATEKVLQEMDANVQKVSARNDFLQSENASLQRQVKVLENEREKYCRKCSKLELMCGSYKSELDRVIEEANQRNVIQTQQKVGNILLEQIDSLLSKKNIVTESSSRKKQLEKRKRAVRSYLESVEAESSKEASDLNDVANVESNLDDIEKAIQKLEMSLS